MNKRCISALRDFGSDDRVTASLFDGLRFPMETDVHQTETVEFGCVAGALK